MNSHELWLLLPAVVLILILRSVWFKGKLGEFKVNLGIRLLLNRREYRLIKNVTLPVRDGSTQIDHLVISPYGIFVIETKNMKGWIFGSPKQAKWTSQFFKRKHQFQNPLRQNHKHVEAVRELLHLGRHQVFNVVVFVGDCTLKTPMPAEVAHGVFALAKYIKSKRVPLLAEYDLTGLIDIIMNSRLQPGLRTNLTHVRNVKRQASGRDCPRCGTEMVERINKRSGEKFLGCGQYPRCKGTRPMR